MKKTFYEKKASFRDNYYNPNTFDCRESCDVPQNCFDDNATCTLIGTMQAKRAYYEDDSIAYMSEMFKTMDGNESGAFFQYISCATDICNLQVPEGFENSKCIAVSSVERYYYYADDGTPYMIEVMKDVDDISYYRLYQQLNLSEVPTPLKAFNDVLVGEVTVLPSSVPSQSQVMENRNNPHPCPLCPY